MRIINNEVTFTRTVDGIAQQRGYEQQRYIFHDDGTITLNALSMAFDRSIVRDVILNMDSAYRPLDSYVRIHRRDRLEGSGWFRFDETGVQADILNVAKGLVHESYTQGRIGAFGAHPISCDVLMAAPYDRTSGEAIQTIPEIMSSRDPFGAVGPEVAPITIGVEYVGVETQETAAGVFECDHWRLIPNPKPDGSRHPPEDMWAIRGSFVFVRSQIAAIGYDYRLTSHRELDFPRDSGIDTAAVVADFTRASRPEA